MPLKTINPTKTLSWDKLKIHRQKYHNLNLKDEFINTKNRFKTFSIQFKDILFDYSKNLINKETIDLLIQLANETYLKKNIESLFALDKINVTENIPVIHHVFRSDEYYYEGTKSDKDRFNILDMLNKVEDLTNKITNGDYKGYTGKPIKNVVNICIGGSLLSIQMVCEALNHLNTSKINAHFISNIDSHHFLNNLKLIDPETSIFVILTKTFTTVETIGNAETIKKWFLSKSKSEEAFQHHFFSITSNKIKALNFGIREENLFSIPKETNGRFSLWSAMGLTISLYIGFNNFKLLLKGAREMDNHFRYADFHNNMPVIAALLNIWYSNFYNAPTYAILPYDDRLSFLIPYLQQLTMESNGKSIDRLGDKINYNTSSIFWGGVGTNSQHSFFQLLHQGTHLVPCDFIISATNDNILYDHHKILLSNLMAQVHTLSFGNSSNDIFEYIPGNKPSNTLVFRHLTPETLGSLITFYEHKIFIEGSILNICSFDQPGVEEGKKRARDIYINLNNNKYDTVEETYKSLGGLMEFIKNSHNSCVKEII